MQRVRVGVIGLGLMGTSITTCLLAAGHPVVGIDKDPAKRRNARKHARTASTYSRSRGPGGSNAAP